MEKLRVTSRPWNVCQEAFMLSILIMSLKVTEHAKGEEFKGDGRKPPDEKGSSKGSRLTNKSDPGTNEIIVLGVILKTATFSAHQAK